MKNFAGILLITLGLLALAYAGLNYLADDKPVEFKRMHTARADRLIIPLAAGCLTLPCGIWLLTVNAKPKGIRRQARRRSEPNCAAQTK